MGGPSSYGDEASLDAMWDACDDGVGEACDSLAEEAAWTSEYAAFAMSCGDRVTDRTAASCAVELGQETSNELYTYGDDAVLDTLWDDCEAGDPMACDRLFQAAPEDSAYQSYGYYCGGRAPVGGKVDVCTHHAAAEPSDRWTVGITAPEDL
ncbi:hypothetical protein [Georgenia alba]|uniref:DUF4189 domain-containing protein n=1 Tax=Georgenia alba TaxID=2233858 RepID=A0ABW2Q798_9MICO